MQIKSLSTILITASTLAYGNAKEAPKYSTSNFFQEIENNVVYYGFNRLRPSGNQMQIIDKHIDELRTNPNMLVRVTSHTDHIGNWEVNLNVSRQRALAIAEYLRENGVPQDQIILDWLGESDPLYLADNEQHKNRRSHISIVKKVVAKIPAVPTSSPDSLVNTSPSEHHGKIQLDSKEELPVQETRVNLKKLAYAAVPAVYQSSKPEIKLSAKPIVVSTPIATAAELVEPNASTTESSEGKSFEFQKNILFVDSITMRPIMADVDLKTKAGKESFTATEAGTLNIDYSESKTRQMDVFAHGYFYESVKIHPGPFQQIIKLKPTVKGEKVEINNLEFVSGKSIMMSDSRKELEKIYISLMMNPDAKIEIGGHVNAPKTIRKLDPKKFKISVDRAKTVYNYLIKKGVPEANISYKGYGNSQMINRRPKTTAEKAQNRRVEIKILK